MAYSFWNRSANREFKQQRRPRLRKGHLKNVIALLQTFSRLFHLIQFVKCWRIFLESNSKSLFKSSGKEKKVVVLCSCPTQNVQSAAFTFPIMQFVFPTKFCLRIVFNFSRDDHQSQSQEKLKTVLMQNFVGKTNCIVGNVKIADQAVSRRSCAEPYCTCKVFVLRSELTHDDRQTLAGQFARFPTTTITLPLKLFTTLAAFEGANPPSSRKAWL